MSAASGTVAFGNGMFVLSGTIENFSRFLKLKFLAVSMVVI